MPLDYRRFNGPEDSVSYKRYTKDYFKPIEELTKELIIENGKRTDGRELLAGRHDGLLFARTGPICQAKGSAYVEMKRTKIMCSVFDPREVPHQNEFSEFGHIYCEVKFAPFSSSRQRRPHMPDAEDKELSVALRQALEPAVCRHLFANYQIDVFVYILEHDGSCLAAAINAAGLALVDAAVPMYDIITAASVAVIDKQIYVDPKETEEYVALASSDTDKNYGLVTISMLAEIRQVTNFTLLGSLDEETALEAFQLAQTECTKILPYIQKVIVKNVLVEYNAQKALKEQELEKEAMLDAKMEKIKEILYPDKNK